MTANYKFTLLLLFIGLSAFADTVELSTDFSHKNITAQSSLLLKDTDNIDAVMFNTDFEPITNYYFNKGTVRSIYWAKIKFRSSVAQKIYLEYVQPHTNRIQFFIEKKDTTETSPVFGDFFPFKKRPYAHRNMVMPIELAANELTTIYIMIDKRNESLNGSFIVWEEDAFEKNEPNRIGFYGLVLGWHFIYFLWVLVFWLVLRKRMLGFYALFIGCTLLYSLNNTGLGLQYLWNDWTGKYASLWFQMTIFLMNISLLLFNVHFFETKNNFPKLHRVLKILIGAGLILNIPHYVVILILSDFPNWYLQVVGVSFGLFFMLVVVGFFTSFILSFLNFRKQKTIGSIFMMIPYIIYTFLIGALVMVMLGFNNVIGVNLAHEETTSLILFEITFFTIAVFLRIRRIDKEREQLIVEVSQSELKAAKARFEGSSSERKRISRDLHDSVGANLTRIITDLDLLNLRVDRQSKDKIVSQIDNTRNFTQSTIQLLRDTIWAMNKDEFSVKEFISKVEAFLNYYLEDKIAWEVITDLQSKRQLTPTQVLNLLRILQEATQNMLKHSEATTFKITIANNNHFKMNIQDNGVGISVLKTTSDDNYGLYNMKKRAEDIDATFHIQSSIGKGVSVEVMIN